MASVAGDPRNTAAWQRLRRQVLAESTVCWICHHDGAGEADHIVAIEDGGPALERANVAPAHGSSSRCWVCDPRRGRCCNQSRNLGRTNGRTSGRTNGRTNGNGRPVSLPYDYACPYERGANGKSTGRVLHGQRGQCVHSREW